MNSSARSKSRKDLQQQPVDSSDDWSTTSKRGNFPACPVCRQAAVTAIRKAEPVPWRGATDSGYEKIVILLPLPLIPMPWSGRVLRKPGCLVIILFCQIYKMIIFTKNEFMQKHIPEVSESILPILTRFKDSVSNIYGQKLIKIILYGSFAKGKTHSDSDIDLMIVLSEMDSAFAEIDRLNDIKYDIDLEYDVYISANPVSEDNFSHSKLPLFKNIAREGIEI